jgi:hypothetical protein
MNNHSFLSDPVLKIVNIIVNDEIPFHPALGKNYIVHLSNGQSVSLYDDDLMDQCVEYRNSKNHDLKILIGKQIIISE